MMTDDREMIQGLGYRRIIAAWKEHGESKAIRQFRVPTLSFAAEDYTDLVEWQSIDRCEPPLTKHLSNSELLTSVKARAFNKIHFPNYPCHTQAVGHCIRLASEASAAVCGEQQRDGFIRAGVKSRTITKLFNTKQQYKICIT